MTFMFESSLRRAGWLDKGLCSPEYNDWEKDWNGMSVLTSDAVARMTGQLPELNFLLTVRLLLSEPRRCVWRPYLPAVQG